MSEVELEIRCFKCGKKLKNRTKIQYAPVGKEFRPVCRDCEGKD